MSSQCQMSPKVYSKIKICEVHTDTAKCTSSTSELVTQGELSPQSPVEHSKNARACNL